MQIPNPGGPVKLAPFTPTAPTADVLPGLPVLNKTSKVLRHQPTQVYQASKIPVTQRLNDKKAKAKKKRIYR